MAHKVNFSIGDFSLIYADITDILHCDDLSFANLETPVLTNQPYQSYPTFNVHKAYSDAAIIAGFDVFSLANNHTGDQGRKGIIATKKLFDFYRKKNIYSAGIKASTIAAAFTHELIEIKGRKILFVAITELSNSSSNLDLVDFIPPTKKSRAIFLQDIKKLRANNPCDIFILSVHSAEAEYVEAISDNRREYYYDVLDAGVDILWVNHPHITKESQLIIDKGTGKVKKLIMYSVGNTISGQRQKLDYDNPANAVDFRGDSYLYIVNVTFDKPLIVEVENILITTYIDDKHRFVIRKLNDNFISTLNKQDARYYKTRKALMQQIPQTKIVR
jgi:poly-gamma-glutamate synthesis protein (capsule biosynthesis protein)